MLALQLDDVWLGQRWADVCLRPGLHSIYGMGDVLLACTFGRVRTVGIHHPLHRDLLGHQLCAGSKLSPSEWMSSAL